MWTTGGRDELAQWPGVVVVDLGRWGSRLAADIWATVDMGVAVCAGDVAGLQRARIAADVAPMLNPFPTVKVVNGSVWEIEEIRRSTGIDFDAALAWDTRTAEKIRVRFVSATGRTPGNACWPANCSMSPDQWRPSMSNLDGLLAASWWLGGLLGVCPLRPRPRCCFGDGGDGR